MEYKGFTYTLTPKTAWDSLSMLEKSEMMKVAVRNGITGLKTIREKYNEFAKGGYLDWKEKANKYKHLDIDNDRTYDYEGWYNENPQRAWDFLNDNPDAHFDDKYKTVYHPTFSTQSKYSGKKDATYNPLGLVGGTWNKQGTVFTMSPDGYRGPVSMDERAWYLMNAEDNGAQLKEADGSLPIFDGIPWGGVLPSVTVTGNKFSIGGDKDKNTPRPVTTGGAGYVPSMNQSAYRMVEKVGNLGKAAVKAGTKFIKGIVTQEPDAVRNAGIVYLQNLNPENRKVALDAVMHSSEGAHVMSGDAMLDTGLPNYVRAITGNPIQVNYTGSGIFDESKRDTEDGYYRPNLKRDMVNLYLKGDTTGFEDVTDNPYYQNGPDYKKYFRENYPGLSPKTYKMSSDQVPLLLYPNEYEEAINSIGKNIPVEADGWTEGGDNVGHYNRWYKMIDGKLMAIDSDVWDFNPKDWGWMGGNTDDPELVNSVGTPFILKAIRPVQQIGYNQKPINPNKKHSIGGPLVEAAMNEYKNGGGIHIAPSKKGTFTAAAKKHGKSVQAFASQVLAHPENYSPAMRKKANFVRNARHWKHGLGGNLFSGKEKGSQKMQIGLRVTKDRKPFTLDDALANAARIEQQIQALERRIRDDYTLSNDATSVTNGRPQNRHLERRAVEGAKAHAAWEKEHPIATQWGNMLGAVPFAVAAYPLAATTGLGIVTLGDAATATSAGQAITAGLVPLATSASTSVAGAPLYTWADVGLSSLFGAHGIQTAIDEGGVSPGTSLDLVPFAGMSTIEGANALSKLKKYSRLEKHYGGVPHKEIDGTKIYMDDAFPTTHNNHTVWASDDIDYARNGTWSKMNNNTVFDIYSDPKNLSILETPEVPEGQLVFWQGLPYKFENGKISYADNIKVTDPFNIAKSKEAAISGKDAYGYYAQENKGRYIEKDNEFTRATNYLGDWNKVKGSIKTDDVVKYSRDRGYNATRFNKVYDGGVEVSGEFADYPINEIVFNPGAEKFVLPHGASKWNLFKQLPDRYRMSEYFGIVPLATLAINSNKNE